MPASTSAAAYYRGTAQAAAVYWGPTLIWPTITTYWSEDFSSGTWNSWSTQPGTGGTATVSSGVGIATRGASSNWDIANSIARYRAVTAADYEIYIEWYKSTVWDTSFGLGFRFTGSDVQGGIMLWHNADTSWELAENWVSVAAPGTGTCVQAAATWHCTRVRLTGNRIQARNWQKANTEPSTWGIDYTGVSHTAAGNFGFMSIGGSNAPREVRMDNLTAVSL